MLLSI